MNDGEDIKLPMTVGDDWQQAELALAAGDFVEVIDRLQSMLAPNSGVILDDDRRVQAHMMLVDAFMETNNLEGARETITSLQKTLPANESVALSVALFEVRLAVHAQPGNVAGARAKTEALWGEAQSQMMVIAPMVLADLVEWYTTLLVDASRFDEALNSCDQVANAVTSRADFDDQPEGLMAAARVLERMGRVSVQMADDPAFADDEATILERAAAALSVALRFVETALGGAHPAAASVWEAVGDVMERMGHTEEAEEARVTAQDLLG